MTETEIRRLVDERIDELFRDGAGAALKVYGNASKKMIGEMVADALMHRPVVTIDGSGLNRIAGHKPTWRP